MTQQTSSRRLPWLALALSFLAAGVGHVYCGRIAKGLPLYFAWLLIPIGVAFAMFLPPSSVGLVLLLMLPVIAVVLVYLFAAIDAWRTASTTGTDYSLRDYNRIWVYWLMIVVQLTFSIGLVAGVKSCIYEAFVIPTGSMSPTIIPGDRILANKLKSDQFPDRGDMVVYRNPTTEGGPKFVGRVVAVSGDMLQFKGERVWLNGKELNRDRVPVESLKHLGNQQSDQTSYESNSGRRYLVTYGDSKKEKGVARDLEIKVPERHVFILGDNRTRSRDSRHFGAIHAGDIIGQVDYIFWPSKSWSRFGVAN